MPGMDGIEVAKKIRANTELTDTKVLFVTARHDLDSAEILRETGAWGFLAKPVRRNDLVEVVNNALFKSATVAART